MGPQFETVDKSLSIVWEMLSFSSIEILGNISFGEEETGIKIDLVSLFIETVDETMNTKQITQKEMYLVKRKI